MSNVLLNLKKYKYLYSYKQFTFSFFFAHYFLLLSSSFLEYCNVTKLFSFFFCLWFSKSQQYFLVKKEKKQVEKHNYLCAFITENNIKVDQTVKIKKNTLSMECVKYALHFEISKCNAYLTHSILRVFFFIFTVWSTLILFSVIKAHK